MSKIQKRSALFQRLESRDLFAGNVTVSVQNGDLWVWGDDYDNAIVVQNIVGNKWQVTGMKIGRCIDNDQWCETVEPIRD